MSEPKLLRPADGRKVRRQDGKHLAEGGETVELNSYWRRRLEAGDVIEVEGRAAVSASTTKVAGNGRDKGKPE